MPVHRGKHLPDKVFAGHCVIVQQDHILCIPDFFKPCISSTGKPRVFRKPQHMNAVKGLRCPVASICGSIINNPHLHIRAALRHKGTQAGPDAVSSVIIWNDDRCLALDEGNSIIAGYLIGGFGGTASCSDRCPLRESDTVLRQGLRFGFRPAFDDLELSGNGADQAQFQAPFAAPVIVTVAVPGSILFA